MPGSKSNYAEALVLDALLGRFPLPDLAFVYIGLYLNPTSGQVLTDASTGTVPGAPEVEGNGYFRLPVPNDSTYWPPSVVMPTGTSKSNAIGLAWPAATGTWGLIAQWALLDAPTGGNILWWGDFDAPVQINRGDQAIIPAGIIVVTED